MKLGFTTDSTGVHINGVSASNPCIYDNDMILDTPELFFLWLKANKGQVNLVGNVNTRDLFIPPNIVHSHDSTFVQWTDAYNKAMATGLKNIPKPVKGSDDYLRRPASGVPEQTVRKDSVGSDLIISEARKCTAAKPLVIFVGGQVTSIANAYLKDNSIADKIVVLHVDGWDKTDYNGVDYWANEIVVRKMLYCNWDGSFINNQTTWYDPFRPLQVNFNGIPSNPWTKLLIDNYYNQAYARWKDVGDAPPVFWFFDNSVWKNVVRRTAAKQTVTGDTYDYILISDNDWPKYGAMLSTYMVNPQNYIPVTVEPPVNNAPTISILTPSTTYAAGSSIIITATASDDKAVSKVEFFNGSIKLGESLTSPYSWVISNATAGTYNLTGKATDNEGASAVSSVRVVTVSGVVIPPIPPLPAGPKEFRMSDFTRGEGGDDTVQFQKAIDTAIAAYGHLIIDPPSKQYRVRNLRINPLQGRKQVWFKMTQFGWTPEGDNPIKYFGDSNKAVFYTTGLKNTIIEGLNVGIIDGRDHVSIMDLDGDNDAPSIGFSTFINNHYNLGKGQYNVGTRIGHKIGMFPQSNGDISNVLWENCATFGGGASEQSIAGQIAYLHEGRNSLHFNWVGGFGAWLQNIYSNQSGPEAQFDRGNAAVFFDGMGSSQNECNYVVAFQSQYVFDGGRHESSKKFLKVVAGGNSNISIRNAEINDFKTTDGTIIDLNTACTLVLDNVAALRSGTSNFDKMINCNSNGDFGSVDIQSGSFQSTEPLVKKTGGTTQWRVYTRAATRLGKDRGGVFTNGFIPDVNGQIL